MRFRLYGAFAVLGALIAVGCGGQGSFAPTRGEGSIPIGRAQSTDSRPVSLTLRSGGTEYELTPANNGIVYAPSSIVSGVLTIKASLDGAWSEEFSLTAGNDVFDIVVLPLDRRGDVTGISFDHPGGIQLRVGETVKLKSILTGAAVNGLKPTLWTNGGVGFLNPGGVFKATAIGSGTVTGDIFGFGATVNITVVP